jgi:LPXTG-site transpeptidase (sortase) family protein
MGTFLETVRLDDLERLLDKWTVTVGTPLYHPKKHIRVGDDILLTSIGRHRNYQVDSTRVVAPTDVNALNETDAAMLTLITCYPFHYIGPALKRLIVQAHLIRR